MNMKDPQEDLFLKKLEQLVAVVGAPDTVIMDAIKEISSLQKEPPKIDQIIKYILDHGHPSRADEIAFIRKDTQERYENREASLRGEFMA